MQEKTNFSKSSNFAFEFNEENVEDDLIPRENENYNLQSSKIYTSNSAINFTFENKVNQIKSVEERIKERPKNARGGMIVTKKNLPDPKITITYLEKSNLKLVTCLKKASSSKTGNDSILIRSTYQFSEQD